MVYAPQSQSGNFFNRQERNVRSLQVVEALTFSKDNWHGQHVFKIGMDLQHSSFDGENYSQEVDAVRLDGSLAERTTYLPLLTNPTSPEPSSPCSCRTGGAMNDRLNLELGFRADQDDVPERMNYSPRAGISVSVLPEGRGIIRGGFGKFAERTPLVVGAFTQYEVQTVSRYDATGAPLGPPVTFTHVVGDPLKTPESIVQTLAWDQRLGRRFFWKAAYLHRNGSSAYVVDPDPAKGVLDAHVRRRVQGTGNSRPRGDSWPARTRDLSVSYVRSHGTRDLNDTTSSSGTSGIPSSGATRTPSARRMCRTE